MSLKQWLQQVAVGNRRAAERRLLHGFAASYPVGLQSHRSIIHDISATGIYLHTSDRFQQGAAVPLTLHPAGFASGQTSSSVRLTASVIRSDEDGAAFAFEIPSDIDPKLWINLVDTATYESESDDIIAPFKLARALAFLTQICAPQGQSVRQHIRANLTGKRLWNAVEIASATESHLAGCADRRNLLCDPGLALRILDEGSWTESELMRNSWAGLLATSCSASGEDRSNRAFVDLFSQLALGHVRIIDEACTRSEKYLMPNGQVAARTLTADSDDIMRFSDSRDLLRMGRALQHLSELGLLEERFKTSMFVPVDSINITPTLLGLQLYARTAGHIGALEFVYEAPPQAAQVIAISGGRR